MAAGYAAVFRSDNLRRSQLAWAGAITAEWAFIVGLSVFAFEEGGTLAVGIVGLIRMLPSALVAPFASLLGDRYRRDRVVLGLFLAMAAAVAIAGLVGFVDPPAFAIYALAGLHGAASTLSRSAQWSLLPSLVRTPEELVAANSATLSTENIGTLAGPALGGVILAASGPATVFAACAGVYLVSSIALARIRFDETRRGPATRRRRERAPCRVSCAGRRSPSGTDRRPLLRPGSRPRNAERLPRGYLLAAPRHRRQRRRVPHGGVGCRRTRGRLRLGLPHGAPSRRAVRRGPPAVGLPLVAIAVWPEQATALLFVAVIGGGNSILDVAGLTLLQRLLPNEVLTRALGVFWGFAMATVGIGSIVAPALVAGIGVRGALAASGALLPVLAVLTWRQLLTIDRTAGVPREQLDALNGIPMFAPLSVVAKEQLATALVALTAPAGAEVIREGEHGDRFYIILEGTVEVSSRGQAVVTRTARDYFGEIALLRDVPRTATVVAKTDIRLYALERDDFLSGVTGYTAGTKAGEAVVAERLAALDAR